jgi:hypothetical protein
MNEGFERSPAAIMIATRATRFDVPHGLLRGYRSTINAKGMK